MACSRAKGATELGFPRPAPGEMQSEAARRAGDPSHQSEDPPPEGLGDHGPLAQTNPRRPAGQVMRHHLDRQPGAVGGEAGMDYDLILDPFVGSGTTIIAAERQGRACWAMELEPRYVDSSVKRWEDYTGGQASRE